MPYQPDHVTTVPTSEGTAPVSACESLFGNRDRVVAAAKRGVVGIEKRVRGRSGGGEAVGRPRRFANYSAGTFSTLARALV